MKNILTIRVTLPKSLFIHLRPYFSLLGLLAFISILGTVKVLPSTSRDEAAEAEVIQLQFCLKINL